MLQDAEAENGSHRIREEIVVAALEVGGGEYSVLQVYGNPWSHEEHTRAGDCNCGSSIDTYRGSEAETCEQCF